MMHFFPNQLSISKYWDYVIDKSTGELGQALESLLMAQMLLLANVKQRWLDSKLLSKSL